MGVALRSIIILAVGSSPLATPVEVEPTRLIMDATYAHLTDALAASFSPDGFDGPTERPRLQSALDGLSANARTLEAHARTRGPEFEFVARSLARDAGRLAGYYRDGRTEAARFTLHGLTENCIACHGSLPATRAFPDGKAFMARVDAASLEPVERARLQTVTRQFDDALASYEALFGKPDADTTALIRRGAMTDYLRLCIAVKGDLERPARTLGAMTRRPATGGAERRRLNRWLADLSALRTSAALADPRPLERAKALVGRADGADLIDAIAADTLLARFLAAPAFERTPGTAEAYYLRGVAGALLDHSRWLGKADFFFEMAIRTDPGAAFAPAAYGRLAEDLLKRYAAPPAARLAPEGEELLDELRGLISRADVNRL